METGVTGMQSHSNATMQVDDTVSAIAKQLSGSIRVLVLEDKENEKHIISGLLSSPLYAVSFVSSLGQAQEMIKEEPGGWHCWILDLGLAGGNTLTLLKNYPDFYFKIVISDIGSKKLAQQSIEEGGALAVLDKGDPSLPISGLYTINAVATLGFLFGSEFWRNPKAFLALYPHPPCSVAEWSQRCGMERRQLEQLCWVSTDKTPLKILTIHWALTHILGQTSLDRGQNQYQSNNERSFARLCLHSLFG